jgi:hypothetical protein
LSEESKSGDVRCSHRTEEQQGGRGKDSAGVVVDNGMQQALLWMAAAPSGTCSVLGRKRRMACGSRWGGEREGQARFCPLAAEWNGAGVPWRHAGRRDFLLDVLALLLTECTPVGNPRNVLIQG